LDCEGEEEEEVELKECDVDLQAELANCQCFGSGEDIPGR
jgi:hypothetical protein